MQFLGWDENEIQSAEKVCGNEILLIAEKGESVRKRFAFFDGKEERRRKAVCKMLRITVFFFLILRCKLKVIVLV